MGAPITKRIVIIGGGPAGYEAALVAAGRGAEVTVVDSDGIGGACVLYDCVPSKTFIASTGVRTELRRAAGLGFDIGIDDAKITLGQINNRVRTLARSQSADIGSQLLGQKINVVAGRAELIDDIPGMASHRVRVTTAAGGGGVLKADVVLIATGASPRVLPGAEPDGERILNWRQLYDLTELPEHLVIVGSGVTGAEFCNAYTELGVPVTVVASRDQILPHEDRDAAAVLEQVFAERGVTLVKNARADSVARTGSGAGDGVRVTRADGRVVEGSHALMTVGSVPNTAGLGLDRVGIAHLAAGFLVDRHGLEPAPRSALQAQGGQGQQALEGLVYLQMDDPILLIHQNATAFLVKAQVGNMPRLGEFFQQHCGFIHNIHTFLPKQRQPNALAIKASRPFSGRKKCKIPVQVALEPEIRTSSEQPAPSTSPGRSKKL